MDHPGGHVSQRPKPDPPQPKPIDWTFLIATWSWLLAGLALATLIVLFN